MTDTAILAAEPVPQEDIKAGERRTAHLRHIFLQRNHRRKLHFYSGRTDRNVIFRHNCHTIETDSLYGVLPGPERKRKVVQGTEIGIQDQCWCKTACVHRLPQSGWPVYDCKQNMTSRQLQGLPPHLALRDSVLSKYCGSNAARQILRRYDIRPALPAIRIRLAMYGQENQLLRSARQDQSRDQARDGPPFPP